MKNPATPVARRAGLTIGKPTNTINTPITATSSRATQHTGWPPLPRRKPVKPVDIVAPGCITRAGSVLWAPRSDLVKHGYDSKTACLWRAETAGHAEPTRAEWEDVARQCGRLQREMLAWVRTERASASRPSSLTMRPISSIKVAGERIRKDLGDIEGLAASIADIGLLNPITIAPDGTLLAGERRFEACKRLGWGEIPVTVRG